MCALQIELVNPQAINLLRELAAFDLIKIVNEPQVLKPKEVLQEKQAKPQPVAMIGTDGKSREIDSKTFWNAFTGLQNAFDGVADDLELHTEEDVQRLIYEVRYGNPEGSIAQ